MAHGVPGTDLLILTTHNANSFRIPVIELYVMHILNTQSS